MILPVAHASEAPVVTTQARSVTAAPDIPFEGRVMNVVDVQGNKRIEKDAILAKIRSKPGQAVVASQIRSDIQALFSMGFFNDIEVSGDPVGTNQVNVTFSV